MMAVSAIHQCQVDQLQKKILPEGGATGQHTILKQSIIPQHEKDMSIGI